MEINPFILALSKTLPESCLQGLVVYLMLQLLFFIDKRSTPLLKFNLFYLANWFLFAGFVYTFLHHYQQIQVTSFDTNLLQNVSKNNIPTIITKPNLWLQFSFWTDHYAYLITGFYLLGLLFCMLKLTIGIINISWFRSNKNLKLDDYLTQLSIQLSSNFRLIKTVSVFVSDKISVPLTIGFIKPIIVFPVALVNQLSAEQTEAILLHELAHIKRNDYLLNILLCIVQSFLFFNPAIWLMKREINKYREQCCDDLVLDKTQHKLAYAHALLLIEESRSTQLTLSLASNGKKYTLLNRIKRIINMKTNQPSPQNKFILLLLAMIVIGLTVAWNLPVKKAIKHLPARLLSNFKMTETKLDVSKVVLTAHKMILVHKSTYDTSKTKLIADTIFVEHQSRNKLSQKLIFQGKGIVYNPSADTTIKSKKKFKIVLEDSVGNRKEYNSIDELPAEAQKEFLKENKQATYFKKWNNFQLIDDDGSFQLINDSSKHAFNNPDWKKQIEDIHKQYNSPEWKAKIEKMRKQADDMRRQYDSPEFKKHFEELRKQGEELRRQFDNPEWKAKMKKLQEESKALSEQVWKQFDTPEFKKQMEKLQKQEKVVEKQISLQLNNPEFK